MQIKLQLKYFLQGNNLNMRKKTTIILLFVVGAIIARAQIAIAPYVICSGAGYGSIGTKSFYYSIGEPIITTGNNGSDNLYYTQGFLQPNYGGYAALGVQAVALNISCPDAKDGSITLNISGGHGKIGIVWQGMTTDTTVLTNLVPGTYTVNLYDTLLNGAVAPYNNGNPLQFTLSEVSQICAITIYNSFSPNQDGKNEVFYIGDIAKYPENEVYIFNRWGIQLWAGKNYDNVNTVWNGKDNNGNALVDGTYYYIINLKGSKSYKGWVELTK